MSELIEVPMLFDDVESVLQYDAIFKASFKGDPFLNRPYKTNLVTYCDAESCRSGVHENDKGIITHFVCDRCKKTFKADKAKAIKIRLNEAPIDDGCLVAYQYERAFCGKCFKKTQTLREKIFKAICEFDENETVR